jgi:integrase
VWAKRSPEIPGGASKFASSRSAERRCAKPSTPRVGDRAAPYGERVDEQPFASVLRRRPRPPVFPAQAAKRQARDELDRRGGEAAGLGHVTPQALRRSFASIAARRVPDGRSRAYDRHSLDVWVRHYVGRFGADARADARRRLLDAGLGTVEAAPR